MNTELNFLKKMAFSIPFVWVLSATPSQVHKSASKQLAVVVLASISPILISALIEYVKEEELYNKTYCFYVLKNLSLGELYIYVIAFCAPIIWTFHKYDRKEKQIKDHYSIFILCGLLLVLSVTMFSTYRAGTIKLTELVRNIGFLAFGVSIVLSYIMLIYDGIIDFSYEKKGNKDLADLTDKFNQLM